MSEACRSNPPGSEVGRWLRRHKRLVALGVALLLGCSGLAGYYGLRPGQARSVLRAVVDPIILTRVEGLADEIEAAACESGLDPCLVAAVVYAESSGRVGAISSADALGLMQLLPAAVGDSSRRLGIEEPDREQLLTDPLLNLRLGSSHLAWTLEHEGDEVERALVAYNAGRGRLAGWIRDAGSYTRWREERLRAGSPVLAYARRVLEYREVFRERGEISPCSDPVPDETDPEKF